jgi:cytochrome c-type biogenesis protein
MEGSDLTLLVAFGAGLLSFLSPCVLPLVPAYIGQLTVVAVVGRANAIPSRWLAVRHAVAYVLGFGAVFTILGITATFVGGPLADYLPAFRTIGGILLIVMGLNLAGVLKIPALDRTWRPLEAGAAGALAQQTGTVAFVTPGADAGPGIGNRLGGRLVGGRGGILSSFGLGVVFAIGWTPCIGIILGGILTVAASSGTTLQGGLLLVAYTLGLGIPFILMGVLYDRAPALVRPLVRHGRAVSFVGGMLVAVIGVLMLMDGLGLFMGLSWFSRLAPGI